MMPNPYTKKHLDQDLNEIKEHIMEENLEGASITKLLEDVHEHYEVATRFNWKKSKGHYRDLLSRLVETYGH